MRFPFSAVVGQDDAKLALLLAAAQPLLGGVLLRGDKGSAKTTLARGLSALLPGDAPFVELPLGAGEERVIGSIELSALLAGGAPTLKPGLLAAAHGGVLYVDEINLLPDHLVDALLDVATSGVNRVERDGLSCEHPARFVLVGSMNPEEGELRPQLLDRFGFAVDVRAAADPEQRAEVVRRRLAIEADAGALAAFEAQDGELRERLARAARASTDDALIGLACRVALEVGAEGLRADLMLCRAAAAHAGWHGRAQASADDLQAVARFVLAHRRRRTPLEPPGIAPEELEQAFERAQSTPASGTHAPAGEGGQRLDSPAAPLAPPQISAAAVRAPLAGKRASAEGPRGRLLRALPVADASAGAPVLAGATALAFAERRAAEPEAVPSAQDLRVAQRAQRTGNLVILCVDASGSMGAERRMGLAKGALLGLLGDAYQRRDRVALITFAGDRAELVLRPTASVEIAQARLRELPTGGASPIAEGLETAYRLATGESGDRALEPLLVLITDGRATGASDAFERSLAAARRFAEARITALVIDAEAGTPRLGLSGALAETLDGSCLPLEGLADGSLERTIRLSLQ
jgi:magnesium chelatase subunit D